MFYNPKYFPVVKKPHWLSWTFKGNVYIHWYFDSFSFWKFVQAMESTGLSMTDVMGLEATLLINGAVSMVMLKILSMKTTLLTDLMFRLSQLNSLLKIEGIKIQNIANGIIKKSIWVFCLGFVFLFSFEISNYI